MADEQNLEDTPAQKRTHLMILLDDFTTELEAMLRDDAFKADMGEEFCMPLESALGLLQDIHRRLADRTRSQ